APEVVADGGRKGIREKDGHGPFLKFSSVWLGSSLFVLITPPERANARSTGTRTAIVLPMSLRFSAAALIATAAALLAGPAWARCSKNLVERLGPGTHFASLDGMKFAAGETSPNRAVITFVGHASYQIDTPQGVRAITDYN